MAGGESVECVEPAMTHRFDHRPAALPSAICHLSFAICHLPSAACVQKQLRGFTKKGARCSPIAVSAVSLIRACCHALRASRSSRAGRCWGQFRAGIRVRIGARAWSLRSIASMFPVTICGGWTGVPTGAPTASSSRSSRPTPTCDAAWCSIPADRWNSDRTGCPRSSTPGESPGRSPTSPFSREMRLGFPALPGASCGTFRRDATRRT